MSDAVRTMVVCDFGGEAIDRARALLSGLPGGIEKAVKSAMPRAVTAIRKESVNAIQQKYDISATNLRTNQNVKVQYSLGGGVGANITFNGKKIPLYRYNRTTPKSPTVDKSKTVNAVISGEWRKVHPGKAAAAHQLKSTSVTKFDNAFIARMESGHVGIFERISDRNEKIKELMGSSVPQMLENKEVQEEIAKKASEKFEERMDHEILRILNGWR